MISAMSRDDASRWTPQERVREQRARATRSQRDREKTREDRLEETLRLSRLVSELQHGAAQDVPGR